MIKPLLKPTKKEKVKKKKQPDLKKLADAKYQEVGRELYDRCLICGGEYSCLHHFVKKSRSTALRYDFENGIPICVKCHSAIHQGKDDTRTARIAYIKGEEWLDRLTEKAKDGAGKYYGKQFYKDKIKALEEALK